MIAQEVIRLKPKRVIMFAYWAQRVENWKKLPYLSNFLGDTLRHLREGGVDDIVLLGPSPAWEPSLPMAVYQYWLEKAELPDRLPNERAPYQLVDDIFRSIAQAEGGTLCQSMTRFVTSAVASLPRRRVETNC